MRDVKQTLHNERWPAMTARMGVAQWVQAARPKTLAAGVVPIAVGSVLPLSLGYSFDLLVGVACLAACLLLQIGCNLVNDAADGANGTDANRVGPQRAVGAGLISVRGMWMASIVVLSAAFAVGLYLSWLGGWPIFALGLFSLVAAIGYTAGPAPLAYVGLGDLFVLLFFGLLAVLGSAWLQLTVVGEVTSHALEAARPFIETKQLTAQITPQITNQSQLLHMPLWWWWIALAVGLQATVIIAINNHRDRSGDQQHGKRTLAVRLGETKHRWYVVSLHLSGDQRLGTGRDIIQWSVGSRNRDIGGTAISRAVFTLDGPALNSWLGKSALVELCCGVAAIIVIILGTS